MIVASACWDSNCSRFPRPSSSAGAAGSSRRGRRSRCSSRREPATSSRCWRCGASETTEAARATDLLKQAFPSPFADYVAIVVHGPVRWTNQRFERVLDTLKAVAERQSYVSQIISVRSIGESSFVSPDRRTTFLIAALTPEFTSDISKSIVPDLRAAIRDAMGRVPGADGFDVMVTGFPALDHDVRTISAEDSERGEQRVLPLTLVVLIVAFGALVAAMVPIVVGVLAVP